MSDDTRPLRPTALPPPSDAPDQKVSGEVLEIEAPSLAQQKFDDLILPVQFFVWALVLALSTALAAGAAWLVRLGFGL